MPNEEGIEKILGEDGPFPAVLKHFKPRPGQQKMAALVELAMSMQDIAVVEAPSGSGKTLAYLVPILVSGKRAIISTANHYLQNQLLHHDIPLAQQALSNSSTVAVLMGRSNYLCPYYLNKNTQLDSGISFLIKAKLTTLSRQFRSGVNSAQLSLKLRQLRPYATTTTEECLGIGCPEYHACPYFRARDKAIVADIVVVNHSLLFSNQMMEVQQFSSILPRADVVVVDEAHRIAEFSQSVIGDSLSSWKLKEYCNDLLSAITTHANDQKAASVFVRQLLAAVDKLISTGALLGDFKRDQTFSVIEQIQSGLQSLAIWLEKVADREYTFKHLLIRNQLLQNKLKVIADDNSLYWLEGDGRFFAIRSIPRNFSEKIRKLITVCHSSWVFTSATLLVENSADCFFHAIGLDKTVCHQLASDFDHFKNARLYLPELAVTPDHDSYSALLVDKVLALLQAINGRILFLFTSYVALNRAAALLSEAKKKFSEGEDSRDCDLFVQGTSDNVHLIEQFKNCSQGILLGTGSFWEGLDLSSVSLSGVIIDKLPFSSPADPLVQLKTSELDEFGIDSFQEYLLPEAVIRLRQGCGRLLRRSTDKGVIMLADPRLHQKDYGAVFFDSLPKMKKVRNLNAIAQFMEVKEKLTTTEDANSLINNCE